MTCLIPILLLSAAPQEKPAAPNQEVVERLIAGIALSGQVLTIAEKPSERVEPPPRVAPGNPPLLAFRYFEGQSKHRFGQLDLVMDDAGH